MSVIEPRVYVGMGGWQLESFNNVFYPPNPPKGFRKLQYYGQFFDTVEVNATYYTTALTPKNAFQWLEDVAGNKYFVFSVKLYKGFTHSFDATQRDVKSVHRLLEPLAAEEKLSGLLMQFPYSFSYDKERCKHLEKLSSTFGPYRLFVEVRHNSWNTPETLGFFQQNNLHFVNVDLPKIKKHMPLTDVAWGGVGYVRLMGRNAEKWDNAPVSERYKYRYSSLELEDILQLINGIRSRGNDTYVIFHNDPQANSLVNGFQIRHYLRPKEKQKAPENLIEKFRELRSFSASTSDTPSLFDT